MISLLMSSGILKMNIFVLLLTSLVYNGIDAAISSCDFRRTDDCYKNAIILSQIDIDFENEDHKNEACQIFFEAFECLEGFIKECLNPALQEVNRMLAAKPLEMLKEICLQRNVTDPQNLETASCIQEALASDYIKLHTEVFLEVMEKAQLTKNSHRMHIVCCGAENLFRLTVEKVSATCRESSSNESNTLSELPASRLRDMFCKGLNVDVSKCSDIQPSYSKGQYGELRIVKSMSSFMEILITETFENA